MKNIFFNVYVAYITAYSQGHQVRTGFFQQASQSHLFSLSLPFISLSCLSVSITGREHMGCVLAQRLLINTITDSAAVMRQT